MGRGWIRRSLYLYLFLSSYSDGMSILLKFVVGRERGVFVFYFNI